MTADMYVFDSDRHIAVLPEEKDFLIITPGGQRGSVGPKGDQGDPGPTGPQGPMGPRDAGVEFQFMEASTTWTCAHNLGYKEVTVDASDAYGRQIYGDIHYTDTNNLTITWFYPTAGSVRISV